MAKEKLKVDLTPLIRKLEIIARKNVKTTVLGNYKSVFRGFGLDFSDYRAYSKDDDASKIDWKASARTNELLVKEYEEERNLNVFFLVDVSSNMIFGSADKLKNEYSAELVASLLYMVLHTGDKVGFCLFNDKPLSKTNPSKNRNTFYIFAKEIVNPNNHGGNFDFIKAVEFIESFLPKNSVVMIVSDFLGLKEKWLDYLKTALSMFDIILLIVRDQRDYVLPEDSFNITLSDPKSDRQIIIDPKKIKEKYETYVLKQTEHFKELLNTTEADYVELRTDKPFIEPITDLFRKRRTKWR